MNFVTLRISGSVHEMCGGLNDDKAREIRNMWEFPFIFVTE